ncbi:MAG: D-arabinono-1,4-lactone oxidase [Chloroflexia bacterium]
MSRRGAAEVAAAVRAATRAGATVRVAGSGHSFVPLCATDGLLVTLDALHGVVGVDAERRRATIWAGTKLHRLGPLLHAAGLAMANMGDIDRQSLGGAVGTGTHGTGPTLGSISTQVVGMRLATADGDLLDCSADQDPEGFSAARVAVGALGIATQITLQLLPAYKLHERTWVESFEECMGHLDELIAANRHFEFFWLPTADACAMKALNPTEAEIFTPPPPPPSPPGSLGRYTKPERVDWSYRVLPSERNVRFNEMEFAVPAERGPECLREIRALMQTKHLDVTWAVEYRTLRADDIPLGPAQGRETVTISIHQAAELLPEAFFADAEAIFRNHRGRPHWGKCHSHRADELRALYPRWEAFDAVRARLDPNGRFLNGYLREVLVG